MDDFGFAVLLDEEAGADALFDGCFDYDAPAFSGGRRSEQALQVEVAKAARERVDDLFKELCELAGNMDAATVDKALAKLADMELAVA